MKEPTPQQRECMHENFAVKVDIARLKDNTPMKYAAEVQINCEDCGLAFRFRHLPHVIGVDAIGCSIDATRAYLPIEPEYEKLFSTHSKVIIPPQEQP